MHMVDGANLRKAEIVHGYQDNPSNDDGNIFNQLILCSSSGSRSLSLLPC